MFPSQLYTLDNGLRVVVRPNHAAPVAAVYLWFDHGSLDEGPDEHGAAHFLEHLVFKGTPSLAVGQAARVVEGLGGDLNAYTTYDQTVYHCTLPAEHWQQGLEVLADMARNATFDAEELERERQVVLEEIRGAEDDPDSVIADAAMALSFGDHPYGRPILGTLESVKRLSRERMLAFRERGYRPERALVAVAGAVDPDSVREGVARLLGDWPSLGSVREVPPAPDVQGVRSELLKRSFATAQVELMWRTPPLGHPDNPALDVLATLLAEGMASPLTRGLEGVAQDMWASLSARPQGGAMSAGFVPNTGRTADAVKKALEILDDLQRHLTPTTVARAARSIGADRLFRLETVDGLAHEAAWYTARFGSPEAEDQYYGSVAAVTLPDVLRVARTWLRRDQLALSCLDANTEKKAVQRWLRPPPVKHRTAPKLWRKVLDNGVTLLVLPEDSPIASVRAITLGGRLLATARTGGREELWSQAVTAGAGDLDDAAMAEALDELAGTLDGVSTRSTLGVRASFPAEHLEAGLDLVGAVLAEPWFADEDVQRLREEHESLLQTQHDHPTQVASDLAWSAVWRGHPWRIPELGTASSVSNLGARSLKHLHNRCFTGPNLVVGVVGGCGPEAVIERLENWLDQLPEQEVPLPERGTPGPLPRTPRRALAGREQATVMLALRGVSVLDPDATAAFVAAAALGGQGGRLFLSLREERSLAYQTWASHLEGWDGGLFELGLSTEPARIEEARTALREQLDRLLHHGLGADELEHARRRLTGQSAVAWQRGAVRASALALYERLGLPWHLDDQLARLQQVTLTDVNRALARIAEHGVVEVVVEPQVKE